jgi:glycosyltransferase involved in cell wall biosynthesis
MVEHLVTIVLCTYDGEDFLAEQLNSFAAQTHTNWRLYVSDDGSTDGTHDILQRFSGRPHAGNDVALADGPGKGFAANFLTAICQAPVSDFYAISDQDDIWQPRKLERALAYLSCIPATRPALYCGRSRIADASGRPVGLSPLFARPPSFANALVQNIGGGNTMVMNHAARELLREAGTNVDVVSHDWWIYQLISGAGGRIIYDSEPHILYRQHPNNLVGENNSLPARLKRVDLLLKGLFKSWMDRNLSALEAVRHLLTPDNQQLLDALIKVRRAPFHQRIVRIRKLGIERQTLAGNFSLLVATALGKF